MRKTKQTNFIKKLMLSIGVLLFMACVAEIALRVTASTPTPHEKPPRLPWCTYHPTLGWVNRADYHGRQVHTNIFDVAIDINSQGLRDQEYTIEPTPSVFRILLLGDSFTFGHGVEEKETYATHLEEMLPGIEVINSAVQGTGHDQQLLWLKEEGFQYEPDLILWGFSSADIPRNTVYFRRLADPHTGLDYGKPRYVLEGNELILKNVPTPEPEEQLETAIQQYLEAIKTSRPWWDRWLRHSKLYTKLAMMMHNTWERQEQMALARALMLEMIDTAKQHDIPLVVVNLPVQNWLNNNHPVTRIKRRMADNLVQKVCEAEEIPLLDLTPTFENIENGNTDSLFIPNDGHYSPSGHLLIAQTLKEKLVNQSIIPPARGRAE